MAQPENRAELIRTTLQSRLAADHVHVDDDSALHAGHLGAAGGGGHFRVVIVSSRFDGLSRVAAQRLVFDALGELMAADIHALEMRTFTPDQWSLSHR
jgi:BolA protein